MRDSAWPPLKEAKYNHEFCVRLFTLVWEVDEGVSYGKDEILTKVRAAEESLENTGISWAQVDDIQVHEWAKFVIDEGVEMGRFVLDGNIYRLSPANKEATPAVGKPYSYEREAATAASCSERGVVGSSSVKALASGDKDGELNLTSSLQDASMQAQQFKAKPSPWGASCLHSSHEKQEYPIHLKKGDIETHKQGECTVRCKDYSRPVERPLFCAEKVVKTIPLSARGVEQESFVEALAARSFEQQQIPPPG